jgi:hypothetical protein
MSQMELFVQCNCCFCDLSGAVAGTALVWVPGRAGCFFPAAAGAGCVMLAANRVAGWCAALCKQLAAP